MTKTTMRGVGLLVVVFAVGLLGGFAIDRSAQRGPTMTIKLRMPELFDQLELTVEQRRAADSVLERSSPRSEMAMREMVPRIAAINDSVNEEIGRILTPAQRKKLDSLTRRPVLVLKRKDSSGVTRVDTIQPVPPANLRREVDSLHASMVAAFKRDPASVAAFYADDARIIGMGNHSSGRADVDRYWGEGMAATDWTLEVIDVGGATDGAWVLGRSTLIGAGGLRMTTDYLAILMRGKDGKLRYRIDLFTPAGR